MSPCGSLSPRTAPSRPLTAASADAITPLSAGAGSEREETNSADTVLTIPADLAPGTYYIGARADGTRTLSTAIWAAAAETTRTWRTMFLPATRSRSPARTSYDENPARRQRALPAERSPSQYRENDGGRTSSYFDVGIYLSRTARSHVGHADRLEAGERSSRAGRIERSGHGRDDPCETSPPERITSAAIADI